MPVDGEAVIGVALRLRPDRLPLGEQARDQARGVAHRVVGRGREVVGGREGLAAQKEEGLKERLAAIRCLQPGPPIRSGCRVFSADGAEIGVLQGCFDDTFG